MIRVPRESASGSEYVASSVPAATAAARTAAPAWRAQGHPTLTPPRNPRSGQSTHQRSFTPSPGKRRRRRGSDPLCTALLRGSVTPPAVPTRRRRRKRPRGPPVEETIRFVTPPDTCRVLVSNLNPKTTTGDIRQLFNSSCGLVHSVVLYNSEGASTSQGSYALVLFYSVVSAKKALRLHGHYVHGEVQAWCWFCALCCRLCTHADTHTPTHNTLLIAPSRADQPITVSKATRVSFDEKPLTAPQVCFFSLCSHRFSPSCRFTAWPSHTGARECVATVYCRCQLLLGFQWVVFDSCRPGTLPARRAGQTSTPPLRPACVVQGLCRCCAFGVRCSCPWCFIPTGGFSGDHGLNHRGTWHPYAYFALPASVTYVRFRRLPSLPSATRCAEPLVSCSCLSWTAGTHSAYVHIRSVHLWFLDIYGFAQQRLACERLGLEYLGLTVCLVLAHFMQRGLCRSAEVIRPLHALQDEDDVGDIDGDATVEETAAPHQQGSRGSEGLKQASSSKRIT